MCFVGSVSRGGHPNSASQMTEILNEFSYGLPMKSYMGLPKAI
jgi:hypothetical protein